MTQPRDLQSASGDDLNDLLMRIAVRADRIAFERLFRLVAPRVKAYLLKRGAENGVAEDIAQETMLTVWRKAAMFDPARASVSTWIFTIARNLSIDFHRRASRPAAWFDDPSQTRDETPGADILMVAAERDMRVREALGRLPPEQADIVRLSFFSDKPHSEIARLLDIPLGTVKSRVRLAMNRLRTGLEESES